MRILDSNDALIDDIDQISRYVTQSEFATFQQTVQDGVNQLAQIQDQVDVFVETAITTQKGYANGIAPLDPNVKIEPTYLPEASTAQAGIVQLVNDLSTGGTNKALTAAQGKILQDTKLDTFWSFGINQSWQNATGSRAVNVTYINTTGRPIFVCVRSTSGNTQFVAAGVNGITVTSAETSSSFGAQVSISFVVPNGGNYSVSGSFSLWAELR